MNLKEIQEILNLPVDDASKGWLILQNIAKDPKAIVHILSILDIE